MSHKKYANYREKARAGHRRFYKSEKYRYFERVLIANKLWQPPRVERT